MRFSSRSIRAAAGGVVAAVVLATGVAACGSSDEGSGGGKVKAGTTIEYWASNQGATIDQDKQVINDAIGRFKKETGVNVKFKVIPWSDLFTNITTATTSGKGPDVLNIGNTWSATLQSTGAFIPFAGDDLKAIGGKEKFLKTSFSASGAPGKEPTSVPI
jgi:multiple sugar transport system substrate-binding protein